MINIKPATMAIGEAVQVIAADGVVAYPTETVYGLAVNPFSEKALDALFEVKERGDNHPVLLIVADDTQIGALVSNVSPRARNCMKAFWPGPLSLLFPPVPNVSQRLLGDSGHVCVRCPSDDTARELCRRWGGPLTSTSANLTGLPPARAAVDAALSGVALVLDGGCLKASDPSTVYDPDAGRVLRPGPITTEMIEEVCSDCR